MLKSPEGKTGASGRTVLSRSSQCLHLGVQIWEKGKGQIWTFMSSQIQLIRLGPVQFKLSRAVAWVKRSKGSSYAGLCCVEQERDLFETISLLTLHLVHLRRQWATCLRPDWKKPLGRIPIRTLGLLGWTCVFCSQADHTELVFAARCYEAQAWENTLSEFTFCSPSFAFSFPPFFSHTLLSILYSFTHNTHAVSWRQRSLWSVFRCLFYALSFTHASDTGDTSP